MSPDNKAFNIELDARLREIGEQRRREIGKSITEREAEEDRLEAEAAAAARTDAEDE